MSSVGEKVVRKRMLRWKLLGGNSKWVMGREKLVLDRVLNCLYECRGDRRSLTTAGVARLCGVRKDYLSKYLLLLACHNPPLIWYRAGAWRVRGWGVRNRVKWRGSGVGGGVSEGLGTAPKGG